jgi:putative membrane protein
VLAAGYLFTAAIIGSDPHPGDRSRVLVACVLVAAVAAHGVLAKYLYAHPPHGVGVVEAEAGAQVMYYGGALIEGVIIVVFCARWYRAAGRRMLSTTRRTAARRS